MFESMIIWSLLIPGQNPEIAEVPVQSVVVSLIDDVELALGESGIVQSVKVRPGLLVKRGDLLVELETLDAELELQRVEADLAMAKLKASNDLSLQLSKKSLAVAKTELSRAIKANEKFSETVSASEIDRLQLTVDEAELQIQQAQHDLEYQRLQVRLKEAERAIIQRQIGKRQLHSPIDGVIVDCRLQPGEFANPEQPLCRVINTDRIRVEGFVSTSEHLVRIGDQVRVSLADSGMEKISGEITFVDPEIDTITKQYKVWAEIKNKDLGLRPGMRPGMVIVPSSGQSESEALNGVSAR